MNVGDEIKRNSNYMECYDTLKRLLDMWADRKNLYRAMSLECKICQRQEDIYKDKIKELRNQYENNPNMIYFTV